MIVELLWSINKKHKYFLTVSPGRKLSEETGKFFVLTDLEGTFIYS
jgi:hypothetical protein